MRGWRQPPEAAEEETPRGFDDFDLRLGDIMRGERATIGRSLLDAQRELKIRATYIAAIENADLSAFEAPGFIAGYVRSYARYLGLDPDWAFETFCAEAGFVPPSGLGPVAPRAAPPLRGPVFRKDRARSAAAETERDPIAQPRVSFAPARPGLLSGLQPRAIGSTLVLLLLIAGLAYGAWSVLKEVQKVTVVPVERSPEAVAQIDPLDAVSFAAGGDAGETAGLAAGARRAVDSLYRPQALDTPRMVPRDGPIAQLDPRAVGTFATLESRGADPAGQAPADPIAAQIADALAALGDAGIAPVPEAPRAVAGLAGALGPAPPAGDTAFAPAPLAPAWGPQGVAEPLPGAPRVTEDVPEVVLLAVARAWVRVRSADGALLLERVMQPGESWVVPATEAAPTLRTGAAGAVFFAVNGVTHGPAGATGAVVDGIALAAEPLSGRFAQVDPEAGIAAREAVAVAQAALSQFAPAPGGE